MQQGEKMAALSAVLVALLASAAVAGGSSPCDGVDCRMGTCVVDLLLLAKCVCNPGWTQLITPVVPVLDAMPCNIPNCSTGDSCFNITLPSFNITPPPTPEISVCELIDICGSEGTCVKGEKLLDYECQCRPGAVNMLNNTAFPCVRNCVIGNDGCPLPPPPSPPPPPPPSSSSPEPPPPGNHGSSGSASSLQNLLLLLLLMLASLAAAQIM